MRPCLPALCAAPVLPTYPLAAVDQIVTLGDSLSFAYEVEFGFEVEILGGLLGKSPSEIDMPFTPFFCPQLS